MSDGEASEEEEEEEESEDSDQKHYLSNWLINYFENGLNYNEMKGCLVLQRAAFLKPPTR